MFYDYLFWPWCQDAVFPRQVFGIASVGLRPVFVPTRQAGLDVTMTFSVMSKLDKLRAGPHKFRLEFDPSKPHPGLDGRSLTASA